MAPRWHIILGEIFLIIMALGATFAREFTIAAIYYVGYWIIMAIYDSMRDEDG